MAQLSVYLLSCGCMQDDSGVIIVFNRVCLNLDCKTNQYTECALAFVNYWSTTHLLPGLLECVLKYFFSILCYKSK